MKKKFSKNFAPKQIVMIVVCLLSITVISARTVPASESVKESIFIEPVANLSDDFMMGVDISSLADIEKNGGVYYNANGEKDDLFNILKENGVNWVRLRIWNNPTYAEDLYDYEGRLIAKKGDAYGGGNNSVEVDIPLAVRAKKAGMKLLLDFHYSDTWADPGKQNMPQDWKNFDQKQLNAAVEEYTRESLNKFAAAGAYADAVQIGNELNGGFMWPLGKTWADGDEKIGGMKAFTTLLHSASRGVRSSTDGDKTQIVIHLADGADNGLYRYVFDAVKKAKIDYDIIGLSFYNYWHGTPAALKANMEDIAKRYGKKLAVVETSYAFTTEDGDDQGNPFQVFSESDDGYKPSVQGQATSVRDVIDVVASVEGGCGVFYWEPAWLPVKGAGLSATEGATWENQAMFDFSGRVLPSMAVWKLVRGGEKVTNVWGGSAAVATSFDAYDIAEEVTFVTKPTVAPKLPESIKITKNNDREYLVPVVWDAHDWASETKSTVVKLYGTIEGSTFKPWCNVEVSSKVNLIADNSFESGKLGKWKLNGSGTACYIENNKGNAHTGKMTYKYWLGSGFKSILSQDFSDIENGTYVLSIWSMGGGGENNIRLFAANYGDGKNQITSKIVNTGWQVWKKYEIEIPVTNNHITVGVFLDTKPDCWGNFDDIELYKKD